MAGPITLATIRTSAVLGLRLGVQAGTLLLVARLLGPERFGAFTGVAALALILGTFSTFGTHLVLLAKMSKNPSRRASVLIYALPTTLLCGSTLLLIFVLTCVLALRSSGIDLGVIIAIGIAETLLQPLAALAVVQLLAAEHTARSQLMQTLPLVLRLMAALVIFLLQPADPLSAYGYGYLVATAVALGVVMERIRMPWPHPLSWRWPSKQERRESVGYAVLNVTSIGPAELDKTLSAKLLPLGAAGLYAAGARVVGAVTLPVIALMLAALPRLFREGQHEPDRTTRLLKWIFGATALYSVVLAIALWSCAPVFEWLLGDRYEGVDRAIRWLCIAVPGMALRIAAGSALMALGKPWMRAGFEMTGLAVLCVTSILLTAQLGPLGMPLALACAEWTMASLGVWLIVRVCRAK